MSDFISRRMQTAPTSLVHLPEEVHHLLCASQVCGLWRRIVGNPVFLGGFREHHNAVFPLNGVFHERSFSGSRRFTPVGEDRPAILWCPTSLHILDSRHGRVLFLGRDVLVVWDAMTGIFEVISTMPSDWTACDQNNLNGAVVCTAGDDDEGRHGDCRGSPFLVVLIAGRAPRALVSVYSSLAREWSETTWYDGLPMWADVRRQPCVAIGTTLYQPLLGSHILSFDLETRNFAVVPHPPETAWMDFQIMKLDGRTLGLVGADNAAFSLHFWEREEAGQWVLRRTVHLHTLEPQPALAAAPSRPGCLRSVELLGACEFGNVIFLKTRLDTYLFYLDSMQLKKLSSGNTIPLGVLSPYESFYAPRL